MKNEILELKCIDMSVDGQGICKHEGLVVFVKGMILDEEAKVKIIACFLVFEYFFINYPFYFLPAPAVDSAVLPTLRIMCSLTYIIPLPL